MANEQTPAEAARCSLLELGAHSFRYQLSDDGQVSFELFSFDSTAEIVMLFRIFEDGLEIAEFALFKAVDPDRFIQRHMDSAIRYLKRGSVS